MTAKAARFHWHRISLVMFVLCSLLLSATAQNLPMNLPTVHAQPVDPSATVAPANVWGPFFSTSGDVEIDVNSPGIAVRVEIPREFLQGVISSDNDTHFIESNIRNDYYYYSVIDESNRWTYGWRGAPSDGPCFKPNFSLRDPNAPWCVEIWNYLNGTFRNFTPPKFIRFHDLNAPSIAGRYNFTLFVADHTNSLGLPDFVHAWNTTLFVPVSARDRPASIPGTICDNWFSFLPISSPQTCGGDHIILGTKGVAYAKDSASGQIVGRSYVNETTGQFNITGLAPGTYQILASAGFDPTYDTAYSLTAYISSVTLGAGDNHPPILVALDRARAVCGSIRYFDGVTSLAHSLTSHPYLPKIGLKVLNVTVEAVDPQQHVYRNITLSQNTGSDDFKLITGSNVSYVGTDPYGTEFAGILPGTSSTPNRLTLNVWVTGYAQVNLLGGSPETVTVNVGPSPLPGTSTSCVPPSPNPVVMQVGGVISGTLQLWNGFALETPNEAERSLPLPLPPTDALFGGNILIQAYDHLGILRAVDVINGTYANGTTTYRDNSSIPFILYGFNEYFNHTWSGVWDEHDYGLPPDPLGYSVRVYIRGYELQAPSPISVFLGANATATVKMLRGGAFKVGVFSFDNRFGTRAIQALLPFRFLNLSIPVRARTYFYDSSGITVGYVECLIRLGVQQPDPLCRKLEPTNFEVLFAGQNWNFHEIWFYGDTPSHVTNDTYTIKAYTLGYVWQYGPSHSQNYLVGFTVLGITLLFGDELDITGPVFVDDHILGALPENAHAIGQAFNGALMGAIPANLTEGTFTLSLPIFGFGGMTNSTGKLEGQGHFFYVALDGGLHFDYGLDNATYTAQVAGAVAVAAAPEFGFDYHFMQPFAPSTVIFRDLFLQTGVVMDDFEMARVISDPLVTGDSSSCSGCTFDIAPLSWVQVTASNSTFQRTVTTLDGHFVGPGALFLPAGTYSITYSQTAYYVSQTQLNFQIQWGSTYVTNPPSGALCPILPPATAC
ncbi:MAG: carboxypeptidase-like regulatory domain-containing protein [Candidatus Bathyarchaeia archaeon]